MLRVGTFKSLFYHQLFGQVVVNVMAKSKQHNFLIAVGAVCLTFVLVIAFLNVMSQDDFSETNFSEVDFPLEIGES